jgi:hypothetical protein
MSTSLAPGHGKSIDEFRMDGSMRPMDRVVEFFLRCNSPGGDASSPPNENPGRWAAGVLIEPDAISRRR